MRLGRSSTCEISIPDPSLSRNHCLFELRNGAVWVTDLASANGTLVNEETLGANSRKLNPGDTLTAGDTTLQVMAAGNSDDSATVVGRAAVSNAADELDLGLGGGNDGDKNAAERKGIGRGVLWGIAAAVALVAVSFILLSPSPEAPKKTVAPVDKTDDSTLIAFSFERVDASTSRIYRYSMEYSPDGSLHVEYADVPGENRHLSRTVKLSPAALKRLADIFASEALYGLEREYVGSGISAGILKSRKLKIVRGARVFETSVENTEPPDSLRSVCESLEAFAQNELGAWALQHTSGELQVMSADAARLGDSKWSERDVQYGNISDAIKAYDKALMYLDTVNPKPAEYEEVLGKRKTAKEELDRRYRDQRFLVDQAINMQDWTAAQRNLRVLCDMVPDERDPRHAEATAKLLDVEARQKQKKKGSAK